MIEDETAVDGLIFDVEVGGDIRPTRSEWFDLAIIGTAVFQEFGRRMAIVSMRDGGDDYELYS